MIFAMSLSFLSCQKSADEYYDSGIVLAREHKIEALIDAIIEKFGSVEKLAEKLGITKQNICSKIKTQSHNFMDELESHRIVVNEGDNIGASISNNKGTGTNNYSGNTSREVEMLKALCESKDVIIPI